MDPSSRSANLEEPPQPLCIPCGWQTPGLDGNLVLDEYYNSLQGFGTCRIVQP
jgi:hypothetical protein